MKWKTGETKNFRNELYCVTNRDTRAFIFIFHLNFLRFFPASSLLFYFHLQNCCGPPQRNHHHHLLLEPLEWLNKCERRNEWKTEWMLKWFNPFHCYFFVTKCSFKSSFFLLLHASFIVYFIWQCFFLFCLFLGPKKTTLFLCFSIFFTTTGNFKIYTMPILFIFSPWVVGESYFCICVLHEVP